MPLLTPKDLEARTAPKSQKPHPSCQRRVKESPEGADMFRTLLQARQKRFLDALHIVGAEIRHFGSPLTNKDVNNPLSIGAAQPLFLWIRDFDTVLSNKTPSTLL
jgi:hypothetical protein